MLQNLKADKSSICDAMVFSLNNAEAAEEVLSVSTCCQWDAALFGIDRRNLGIISVSDVDPCWSEDRSSVCCIGCLAQQLGIGAQCLTV